ncbi:MAG TPA: YoaK family protein [Mycobacteriales bacterium]
MHWLPWRSGEMHRMLTVALIALTVSCGVVDAVSFLALGRVFVATMTGNVIFLGFALAGEPSLSISASLTALGSFVVGVLAAGRLGARLSHHRGRHLGAAAAVAVVPMAAAIALAATVSPADARYGLITLLAFAMGIQVSTVRRLAVPDVPMIALTMAMTALISESRIAGGAGHSIRMRGATIAALLVGAILGGVLVLHVAVAAGIALATALVAAVAGTILRLAARTDSAAWRPPPRAVVDPPAQRQPPSER